MSDETEKAASAAVKLIAVHTVVYDDELEGRVKVKPGKSFSLTDTKLIAKLLAAKAVTAAG